MWNEAVRIATIVLIALGARLLLDLIAWTNRKIIERNFGAFLARSAKALTLNKLTISILRYAVYLVALGLILGEFGVSLTAYLAGASIIGFAVAFGFQGLIQDLISGVFIILEDQFAVGDMVEIAGQTGRVEEIGLRITKFRNYVGELIVVPNRALSNVGLFPLGCVIATVEIPIGGRATNEALALAREDARALQARYPMAVLTEPEVEIVKDIGGEPHAQVRLSIWPGEKWVVERAFVPRLLARLAALDREGQPAAPGRVVVHYGGKG